MCGIQRIGLNSQTKVGLILATANHFKKAPIYGNDYIEPYMCKAIGNLGYTIYNYYVITDKDGVLAVAATSFVLGYKF